MKICKLIAAFLAVFAVSAFAQDQAKKSDRVEPKGSFVTTVGTQTLYEGKITIKVEELDGKLDTSVLRNRAEGDARQSGGWVHIKPLIKKDAAWFIYTASADEAWWFDGEKHLYLMPYEDHRPEFAAGGIYQLGPKQFPYVPKEVQGRLPKAFKEGFNRKAPSQK